MVCSVTENFGRIVLRDVRRDGFGRQEFRQGIGRFWIDKGDFV
jgi:hypothetical protein